MLRWGSSEGRASVLQIERRRFKPTLSTIIYGECGGIGRYTEL